MKIDKVSSRVTMTGFIRGLRAKGYRKIGSGAYAQVFAKPYGKTVVKVGSMDPYLDYVKACNNSNPLFPKITSARSVTVTNRDSDDYYVVKMERLVPHHKVPQDKKTEAYDKLGVDCYFDFDHPRAETIKKVKVKFAVNMIKTLTRLSRRSGWLDLHDGNIMWRKTGKAMHLVITDPLC